MAMYIEDLIAHGYSCSCRVTARRAIGSCTIVYSRNKSTYALTNHHVVENCITYKEVWDNILKKEVKREFTEAVEVLFPRLQKDSMNVVGYSTVLADIVAYDAPQDIALLKFRDTIDYPSVRWYPPEKAKDIPFLVSLACIGAALGQTPIVTFGHLNGKQIEIDNFEYWLSSAPSIFGNSGGGVFLLEDGKWYFIGIPSRIMVIPLGFSANVVTHMGFFIPPMRIYNFLTENLYQFIFDENYTEEQCEAMRQEKREKSKMMPQL